MRESVSVTCIFCPCVYVTSEREPPIGDRESPFTCRILLLYLVTFTLIGFWVCSQNLVGAKSYLFGGQTGWGSRGVERLYWDKIIKTTCI